MVVYVLLLLQHYQVYIYRFNTRRGSPELLHFTPATRITETIYSISVHKYYIFQLKKNNVIGKVFCVRRIFCSNRKEFKDYMVSTIYRLEIEKTFNLDFLLIF